MLDSNHGPSSDSLYEFENSALDRSATTAGFIHALLTYLICHIFLSINTVTAITKELLKHCLSQFWAFLDSLIL